MKNIVKATLLCAALLLTSVAPSLATDPAKEPAPAAAPADGSQQSLESPAEGGGCPADGKCCGSAACAEAKMKPRGDAAMADCPCKRNKKKPEH